MNEIISKKGGLPLDACMICAGTQGVSRKVYKRYIKPVYDFTKDIKRSLIFLLFSSFLLLFLLEFCFGKLKA